MERIFQHFEGAVDGLAGADVGKAAAVMDVSDGNVILLWLEDAARGGWYRIFIDGTYCGVDHFPACEIDDDLDDGYSATDHGLWFRDRTIERAEVATTPGPAGGEQITLTILCVDGATALLRCLVADGHCQLLLEP